MNVTEGLTLYNKAIYLAFDAHRTQVDKGGTAYIMHVIKVSERLINIDEKIVAILHDVLEDTDITSDDLVKAEFPRPIVEAVIALTKPEHMDYMDYIYSLEHNKLAMQVKIADLEENLSCARCSINLDDMDRIIKYNNAISILRGKICNI